MIWPGACFLAVVGLIVALGLALAAVAEPAVSATGEEVDFGFHQVGEPNQHPGGLLETQMLGVGSVTLDANGRAIAARGTIHYREDLAHVDPDGDPALTLEITGVRDYNEAATGTAAVFVVRVSKSNDPSCNVGTEGEVTIANGLKVKLVEIHFDVCHRSFKYTGRAGARRSVIFNRPQSCRLPTAVSLKPCPAPKPSQPPTTTPSTTTTTTTELTLTNTFQGATETRDQKTDAATPTPNSAGATAHPQSGQTYSGKVTVTGTLPAGYTVYVEFHGKVWADLGPTGGDYSGITEAKGFGAANDVGAFACKPAGLKQGDPLPSTCLAEGADIALLWNP